MNTVIIKNVTDEDFRLLLALASRLEWEISLDGLPEMTDEEDETQEINPQYAGKSYDELLLALLEERTKEEKIPAEIVHKELLSNQPQA